MENNSVDKIIFVCSSDDYHAMDWFHEVKCICSSNSVLVATDYIQNDNNNLILKEDKIIQLYNIEWLLIKNKSKFGDFWRNLVKILATPLQIINLRKLAKKNKDALFHAHSMYYIFLCWLAKVKYVATPMGSDVLVRPDESKLYKYLTVKSLTSSHLITVDSVRMQEKVFELSKRSSSVIQNGIDRRKILEFLSKSETRLKVVSIRGFYPNYQIEELLKSRNLSDNKTNLTFIYPFYEDGYREAIRQQFIEGDNDLGRLNKDDLYSLLSETLLAISIPESDSSPRSVYEAIFCGCCVAVTYSPWIDSLPVCMAQRLLTIDLSDGNWLDKAILKAKEITKRPFEPSREALMDYDQTESMRKVCKEIYKII